MATTDLHLRVPASAPLTAAQHDANMLRLFGFATLAEMMADEDRDYTFYAAGVTVVTLAEGYRYEVAASGATDQHLTTAAGLKLYVLPSDDGSYNLGAFNPAGDDTTDDVFVFRRAFEVAADNTLHFTPRNYYLSQLLENQHFITVNGHGAKLRFPTGCPGLINKYSLSAGNTGLYAKNKTAATLLTHQSSLVKYAGNIYHPNTDQGSTYNSAALAAATPGVGTVWVFVRAVQTPRDDTVPTWTGTGTYATMSYDPADESHYTFIPGTYVVCRNDDVAYRVAEDDAIDHDHETMFGVKLYDIDPATEYYPVYDSGGGSVFENFTLDGTDVSGAPASGFRMRAECTLRNVTVENFSEYGIHAEAQIPQASRTNPQIWGNINRWAIYSCVTRYNGDTGLFCRGQDANASLAEGVESYGNGRVGVTDHSQLGNTFTGIRTWGNGNGVAAGNTGGRSSVVSYGGSRYMAKWNLGQIYGVSDVQTALYASTEPGDDETVWKLIGAGDPSAEFPLWVAGQTAGFYFYGGGIRSTNTARSTWVGCSCSEDEGGVVMQGGFLLNMGGYQPYFNVGGQVSGNDGGTMVVPSLYAANHPSHVWLAREPGFIISFNKNNSDDSDNWELYFDSGNDIRFQYVSNGQSPFLITGEDTAFTFGTSAPIPYLFCAFRGILIGAGNNGRRHDTLTAAPTTGEWARGDIIYNRTPSAGGNVGWICVVAGIGLAATWKTFGNITA